MANQSGSSVFLEIGSTIVGEKELAKLREDSAELAEIKEAMQDAVKDIEVEPDMAETTPPISKDRGWV